MHTFLHQQFRAILNQYIVKHNHILVALSSGQDSLCLTGMLVDLLKKEKYKIKTIYIDHQWKNSSRKHVEHVANITKFTELPVAIYQMEKLMLSEKEARSIRYRILIKHALEENCSAIIVGHNRDDHTETLISNLIRGTGNNGVTSFTIYKKLKRKLSILRPLIHFTRAEITWLCRLFYLPAWSDETNYNFNLKRNRVRYQLIPYISNFFNPKAQASLVSFSQLCEKDNEYIKENVLKLYIKSMHSRLLCINVENIKKQHFALQKRVIRLYFYYHFNKAISNNVIEYVLADRKNNLRTIFRHDKLKMQILNNWLHTYID